MILFVGIMLFKDDENVERESADPSSLSDCDGDADELNKRHSITGILEVIYTSNVLLSSQLHFKIAFNSLYMFPDDYVQSWCRGEQRLRRHLRCNCQCDAQNRAPDSIAERSFQMFGA